MERKSNLSRFLACLVLSLWFGGFTFYAVVVVPIGSEQLGSMGQGSITQPVSEYLNWLGISAGIFIGLVLWRRHSGWSFWAWLLFIFSHLILILLHHKLSGMFRPFEQETDPNFHFWHEVYLTLIAVPWLAAFPIYWRLISPLQLQDPVC